MAVVPDLEISASLAHEGGTLDLNDGEVYAIAKGGLDTGTTTWVHQEARSPFVHGRVVTGSVLDPVQTTVGMFVYAPDHATLRTRLQTLIDAFTVGAERTLTATVHGTTYAWVCERADYQVGFTTEYLVALTVPVALTFMRHPVPADGPL